MGIYQRGNKFYIRYFSNGRLIRESAESDKKGVAVALLRQRQGDVDRGIAIKPKTNRVKFEELAEDVVRDYRVNGHRSIKHVERRLKYLGKVFHGRRMASVTPTEVVEYVDKRQAERAASASINRELAALQRCFNLAIQHGKLSSKPYIGMLREDNVRTGFFEREQFLAVHSQLPEPLRPLATFMFITGWRSSEVKGLEWRHVDFETGVVRLDPAMTKNREPRTFPFTIELRKLFEAQRSHTRQIQRERGRVISHVFHRDGDPIRSFRRSWITACRLAGVPGRLPHDFRRTAVRNLVRASIPERVAMTMTGHKTRSVFERYNIVSPGDLVDAARRLDAASDTNSDTVPARKAD